MLSNKRIPGTALLSIMLLALFTTSCNEDLTMNINNSAYSQFDKAYQSTLPIDFGISEDNIQEALNSLPLLQIHGYSTKEVAYIKPLSDNGETILWLVQFADNDGWILFSNHVNVPPVVAHNDIGYFSKDGQTTFNDLLSRPGPAQVFSAVKRGMENVKNRQTLDLNLARASHAKWSLLISDVPKLKDRMLSASLIPSQDAGARTMAYEHLNMPWVHEMPPFNKFMQEAGSDRCYIGSNNLAIGQLFKFYGKPDDKGWDYDKMLEKWGPEASYTRNDVYYWAEMFRDIANENQPDRICNAYQDQPLTSDGWITHDYKYITGYPMYKNLDLDSTANQDPGGWNIRDVYYHTAIKKQPSILSAWGNDGDSWQHHTWIVDGCERTGSPGNYTYEVHCLWGWEWDEVSYNGWYNHDYMLGWDLHVSTITQTEPDTTIAKPYTYELWIDEMGFVANCQTWIRIDDGEWVLYPDEIRIRVPAGSTVYYRGESIDVDPHKIRLVIKGPGGNSECISTSPCNSADLSFEIKEDVRIGIQALRWAVPEDI